MSSASSVSGVSGETLSRFPQRNFWSWGAADFQLSAEEKQHLEKTIARMVPGARATPPPREEEFSLPPPRITPPESLAGFISASRFDRLAHAYGKSCPDTLRMFLRHVPHPPDLVAFPRTEQDITGVLDWAGAQNIAVIPFGGGSSVVGGVETDVGDSYDGVITVDMQYLNRVLEVDRTSRAARIQGGAYGPELEAQLKPHGLTLRHFPQSFEFSTLGGWIVTRSGGHFASLYTHIDDMVESTRSITPSGVLETRRLPGSGAGPSPDRMIIGSEGTLGILTEAWMRLQDRPTFRASAPVEFDSMARAADAVRALTQSGLFPTNCRLLDPEEARRNRVGGGDGAAVLILGFESADHPLDAWMERALALTADFGGRHAAPGAGGSRTGGAAQDNAQRTGAAGAWRNAFIRMPYYRDTLLRHGILTDTFETAITWDKFPGFYSDVRDRMASVIRRVTGADTTVACRFTHVYPDGPAPYFSWSAPGSATGDLTEALDKWRQIKHAANEVVVRLGGPVTHHHAVGRDHRPGYEVHTPALFRQALAQVKQRLDPTGILNPGVLYDPVDRAVGVRGVMAPDTGP